MPEPTVSIIVITFNGGKQLIQTVRSILAQNYSSYEIIIKDGMSTDNSIKRLPKDNRIYILPSKHEGIYDAMNQAVKKAKGSYIQFLNCGETYSTSTVLYSFSKNIKIHNHIDVFYGDTYHSSSKSILPAPKKITSFSCYRKIPYPQSIFYKRSLFSEKMFDTIYHIRGEYEHFLWCYFRKSATFLYLGFPVSSNQGFGFSNARKKRVQNRLEYRTITEEYIPHIQLFMYRVYDIFTFQTLRRFLRNSKINKRITDLFTN